MTRTVLITGATGSIGTKLRAHFAQRDVHMRLLCLNPRRDPIVTTADLTVYDAVWAREFKGIDAVVHLAGDSSPTASWASVQRFNIDLTLNVFRAAQEWGSQRIVFASSNWVMGGHRFGTERLTTELPPWPTNPYGCAKLFCERAGLDLAERHGLSFIALRIGYCQHSEGNQPGPHMQNGTWGQQMWLSDRDLCHGFERAVYAEDISSAVLNLMSDNPGMRWDIERTRELIGYVPQDGYVAVTTPEMENAECLARLEREVVNRLAELVAKW